ncbi:MAG: hypothetical protein K2W95_18595 [Candidatus Obscuribacterales bacterium]|nr:hypothetical protein [Candidatus Obscuribacterales bacterium]
MGSTDSPTSKDPAPVAGGRTFLPNPGDLFFVLILVLLLVQRPYYLFGDGGTGWHLSTGHYILDHHKIPTTDFISYLTEGKPWLALYWFGDLLMAIADRVAGLNGLALLCAVGIGLLFLLLYRRVRQSGCHFILACGLTALGAIASCVHWFARPHILSFFGTYLFAVSLEDFYRGKISAKKLILTLAVVTVVWTNSHPGFAAGFALCAIYLAVTGFTWLFDKKAERRSLAKKKTVAIVATIAACIAAAFVHPNGIELHRALGKYLGEKKMVEMVKEYQSPKFHGDVEMVALELLFFLLALGMVVHKKRLSVPQALASFAFAHLALSGVRYMPLFVIVALPFIAELFAKPARKLAFATVDNTAAQESLLVDFRESDIVSGETEQETEDAGTASIQPAPIKVMDAVVRKWNALGDNLDAVEKNSSSYAMSYAAVLLFVAIIAYDQALPGPKMLNAGFNPAGFPTTTLDYIKKNNLPIKKGFNEANWGGYIFYKSGIQVFIDDRGILYGEDFYLLYASVINLAPGWQQFLDKYGIEWVIFPKDNIFCDQLKMDGWKVLNEDPAAVVLQRPAAGNVAGPGSAPAVKSEPSDPPG